MDASKPRIVEKMLCSPRGVTMKYVVRGVAASPGGTKKEIETQYKVTSLDLLRKLETVERKKMTSICAKNNLSYKRAMAHFIEGRRAELLESARRQQQAARKRRAERAKAELALVAAAVGV